MEKFKFNDKIKTADGRKGTVQEDQEINSKDVKVQLQGEDVMHLFNEDELSLDKNSEADN